MAEHLTLQQKYEVILYKERHTKATYPALKFYFDKKFKKVVGESTYRNIISNKTKIKKDFNNSNRKDAKRVSTGKFLELEEALQIWVEAQECRNNPVTDDLIRLKATELASGLGLNDFNLSNGTLSRFKSRKGFKSYNAVGEMANVSINENDDNIVKIQQIIKDYDPKDVYNMDETGLYYRLMPSKGISKASIKGFKKLLERVTIAFTVSMTGEKSKPLVIGSAANPRSLKDFDTGAYVDYTFSAKSWMTSSLFKNYLQKLNAEMSVKNRKILLIVDNCPAHKVNDVYENIRIVFLPPNTTGVLQPLDLGIIRSFKCKFRKMQTRLVVHLLDTTDATTLDAYKHISIKDAIFYSWHAWNEVETSTIKACFKSSIIFSPKNSEVNTPSLNSDDVDEINSLISRLDLGEQITVENIIDVEEELVIESDISNDIIIEMIKTSSNENIISDSDDNFVDVNDVKIEMTLEDVEKALKNINNTIIELRNDDGADKEIFSALSKVQNYLYKKKYSYSRNGSMLKWLIKRN